MAAVKCSPFAQFRDRSVFVVFSNHVGSFLSDHDGWSICVSRYDFGHDRAIYNPQARDAIDS
jgi:hypothetical protein